MSLPRRVLPSCLAVMLAACSDDVTGPSDVVGGTWRLQSMTTGATMFTPDDPSRYTVEFAADLRVSVRADCNQCGGTWRIGDGRLTVGPLACTLVGCPTSHGYTFAGLLDGTSTITLEGADLRIEAADGTLLLRR